MSRKAQVDQRKVGGLKSQSLSFFLIFLLFKKSGSFNNERRKYYSRILKYQSVSTIYYLSTSTSTRIQAIKPSNEAIVPS